jgi:hypothetical protein
MDDAIITAGMSHDPVRLLAPDRPSRSRGNAAGVDARTTRMAPARYQSASTGSAEQVTPTGQLDCCPAAHPLDPRPCQGRADAVRIVDRAGAGVEACLLHGAVLLASLDGGRVYPANGPGGSAIAVYTRARELPPFDFLRGPGVDRVATASEAAVSPTPPAPTPSGVDVSAWSRRLAGGALGLWGND